MKTDRTTHRPTAHWLGAAAVAALAGLAPACGAETGDARGTSRVATGTLHAAPPPYAVPHEHLHASPPPYAVVRGYLHASPPPYAAGAA
jgi:hypothetical protein